MAIFIIYQCKRYVEEYLTKKISSCNRILINYERWLWESNNFPLEVEEKKRKHIQIDDSHMTSILCSNSKTTGHEKEIKT